MVGAILVVYNLSRCMFSGSIRDWINSSRRLLRLHFSLPTLASSPSARLQASSSLNLLIQFYTNFIYITIITNMVLAMIIMMLSS